MIFVNKLIELVLAMLFVDIDLMMIHIFSDLILKFIDQIFQLPFLNLYLTMVNNLL